MKILLIITGGVAAFKSLELLRELKKQNHQVRCILTKGAENFITPLSVAALSGEQAYTKLWDVTQEAEIGHIQLARWADSILISPATAHFIAKIAHGLANDLASTVILAATCPVVLAPAMNVQMWLKPITQSNVALLEAQNIRIVPPSSGEMACGEFGEGRLAEQVDIIAAILSVAKIDTRLKDKHVLITAGGTKEQIDPVRFIGNHSSGKQGFEIAKAAAQAGAKVTLVSATQNLPLPSGVNMVYAPSAAQMLAAVNNSLPADVFIGAAAVADWRMENASTQKLKKTDKSDYLTLNLVKTPDILASIASHKHRPKLVIGFAAETENLVENANAKRTKKQCDIIFVNNVGDDKVFGKDENEIVMVDRTGINEWGRLSKSQVAQKIVEVIIGTLK